MAIIETVFVLEKLYKMERELIKENILAIIRNPQFITNRTLFENALTIYVNSPKLSITDCSLLVYAELNKATPLYTFDKDLIKSSSGIAKSL